MLKTRLAVPKFYLFKQLRTDFFRLLSPGSRTGKRRHRLCRFKIKKLIWRKRGKRLNTFRRFRFIFKLYTSWKVRYFKLKFRTVFFKWCRIKYFTTNRLFNNYRGWKIFLLSFFWKDYSKKVKMLSDSFYKSYSVYCAGSIVPTFSRFVGLVVNKNRL